MGLSVLQKWMVEGRGLGVNRTGVWRRRDTQGQDNSENIEMFSSTSRLTHWDRRTDRQTGGRTDRRVFTRAWEVMTVGVSVLVDEPGANKLLTAALTCSTRKTGCDVTEMMDSQ